MVAGLAEDPVQAVADETKARGGQAVAKACVQMAAGMFGKLAILINNAGAFPAATELDAYPVAAFGYMIKNNGYTTFHMSRAALLELKKRAATL